MEVSSTLVSDFAPPWGIPSHRLSWQALCRHPFPAQAVSVAVPFLMACARKDGNFLPVLSHPPDRDRSSGVQDTLCFPLWHFK